MSTIESHCFHLLLDSLGIVNHTLRTINRTEFAVDSIGGVSMNWKNEAIEKLEQYGARKQSLRSIPKEIALLESVSANIRSSTCDSIRVKGSDSGREDVLLSNIMKREELNWAMEQAQRWVDLVESGLSVLSDEERSILEAFYIRSEKGAADRLAGELAMDVKTVYRRKDAALRRFTIALCGCVES